VALDGTAAAAQADLVEAQRDRIDVTARHPRRRLTIEPARGAAVALGDARPRVEHGHGPHVVQPLDEARTAPPGGKDGGPAGPAPSKKTV
jgi:hypothetical protein